MKKNFLRLTIAFSLLLLAGCATQNAYNARIAVGAYNEAAAIAVKAADKMDKDELLWRLQAGSAISYAGNPEESIRQLDLAEDIFQANDRESVFSKGAKGAASLLMNDLVYNYNGMGVDRMFCCLYKAIDFAVLGKINSARSELNRAAQHQENWVAERSRDVVAAYERLQEDASAAEKEKKAEGICSQKNVEGIAGNGQFANLLKSNTGFDYNENRDLERMAAYNYTSAYLAHLCGVFRWINGDGGRNFLYDAMKLHPENPLLAEDFTNNDKGRSAKGNVWIYLEDGLCCHRQEWKADFPSFLLPFAGQYIFTVSMAFPILMERLPAAEAYYVEADGNTAQMRLLEDIDHLIRTEYGIFMRSAVPREISRIILRTSSQAVLGVAAQQTRDSDARTILLLSQLGVSIWGIATSKADTRSWETLPKNVFVQRIPCPADGRICVKAGNMQPLELEVGSSGNAIVWIRRPSALAPAAAKVIRFNSL